MSALRDQIRQDYGLKLLVHPSRYQQLLEALRKDKRVVEDQPNSFLRYAAMEIYQTPYVATHTMKKLKRFYFKRKRKVWERKYKIVEVPILGYLMNMWGDKKTLYY